MRFAVVLHRHHNPSLRGDRGPTLKIVILMIAAGCCRLGRVAGTGGRRGPAPTSASLVSSPSPSGSPSTGGGWWGRTDRRRAGTMGRATITAAAGWPRRDARAAPPRPARGVEAAGRRRGGDRSGAAAAFSVAEAGAASSGRGGWRDGKAGRRSTCRRPPYSPVPLPASAPVPVAMIADDGDAGRELRGEPAPPPMGVRGDGSAITPSARTRYTIDDATCPPADPRHLADVVVRHCLALDRYLENRPLAAHTAEAFRVAKRFVRDFHGKAAAGGGADAEERSDGAGRDGGGIVLDSGCGTGRSTMLLGEMYRDSVVIGVDRSLARLGRGGGLGGGTGSDDNDNDEDRRPPVWRTVPDRPNVLLLRAELSDFWRCCLLDGVDEDCDSDKCGDDCDNDNGRVGRGDGVNIWKVRAHYILYPNPYPKKSRMKSRWYAHPSFPLILLLGGDEIVVRSNWEGYLNEFASAVGTAASSLGASSSSSSEGGDADADAVVPGGGRRSVATVTSPARIREAAGKYAESAGGGPRRLCLEPKPTRGGDSDGATDAVVPMTNFEAKYAACGEAVYELRLAAGADADADAAGSG